MAGLERTFNQARIADRPLADFLEDADSSCTLDEMLAALALVHIQSTLIEFYGPDYPLVEPGELVPPFDAPLIEYRSLPAFSLVVFDRAISYQDEGFQFDLLTAEGRPPDPKLAANNRQILRDRIPRNLVPEMDETLGRRSVTHLGRYQELQSFLMRMDRGQVLARNSEGAFHLAGVFASFPSDLDREIKRFGYSLGKFSKGDNQAYAANRNFVYQFLMEQLGFPICGERHTSAALFARRLQRRREHFAVMVLGQSDRVITTLTSLQAEGNLPRVEKTALVQLSACEPQRLQELREEGYLLDPERLVGIARICYAQHAYHKENVLEGRALSVLSQALIHPLTGQLLEGLDILGMGHDRLLELNDIVRGEHRGSIIYKGRERVNGTADTEHRLMFLSAWLNKHRYIITDYSPDHFERTSRIINSYLGDDANQPKFEKHPALHQELQDLQSELRMAHRLRLLEKLVKNRADYFGRKLQHVQILIILVHILHQEGDTLAKNHTKSLKKLLQICRGYLDSPYLRHRYMERPARTSYERQMVGEYKLLSKLVDQYSREAQVDSPGGRG